MVGLRAIAAAALTSGLLLAPAHAEPQAELTKEQAQAASGGVGKLLLTRRLRAARHF